MSLPIYSSLSSLFGLCLVGLCLFLLVLLACSFIIIILLLSSFCHFFLCLSSSSFILCRPALCFSRWKRFCNNPPPMHRPPFNDEASLTSTCRPLISTRRPPLTVSIFEEGGGRGRPSLNREGGSEKVSALQNISAFIDTWS